jgi:hypothetical protein
MLLRKLVPIVVKRAATALLLSANLWNPLSASANLRHSDAPFVEVFDRDKTGTTPGQETEAGSQVIGFQELANLSLLEAEGTGFLAAGFRKLLREAVLHRKSLNYLGLQTWGRAW